MEDKNTLLRYSLPCLSLICIFRVTKKYSENNFASCNKRFLLCSGLPAVLLGPTSFEAK